VPVGVAHKFFLVVLRACGRSAGGTASLSLARRPGLQRGSSLDTALSASFMRQRIFLGFTSILILFIGIGVYSFWLFSRMSAALEAMMDDSQRWVLAGKAMRESVEGMDFTLSSALAGEEEKGRKWFESYAPVFGGFLGRAGRGASLPGAGELSKRIRKEEERYQTLAKEFWNTSDLGARRTLYFSLLLPLFTEIHNELQEVIAVNEANVAQMTLQARTVSTHAARNMFVVWFVAVGIVLTVYLATRRAIVKPIQSLSAVAKDLGNGNLDQVVPVQSGDEIGVLAAAFNKLSAKLRAYRQITADQILQARQMTEITFSAFPDAILALSVEGRIDFANPAAEELLKGLDSRIGLPLRIREEAENVLRGAKDYMPTSFEKAVPVRIHEHEAYLLPRVIGMRDESGKLFGAAIVLQDVTRFRLMDEVKTNLVSTVSHELKTPLFSIRMGLHLLLEEKIGALNPKQLELLLAAREDSERLLRMINDLLDLARLDSGQTPQHFDIASPGALIQNAAPNLKPMVEANEVRSMTNTSAELPVGLRQIGDVFSNLLFNSGKESEFYFDLPDVSKGAKA
jgi:NtrC-family two-component system sensor histidine kinase KinB